MRIAQLAPLAETVPPAGYGGTELVVSLLTEELVRRGHEVTLFASGDSQTSARLVSVSERPLRTSEDIPRHRWAAYDLRLLLKLEEMLPQFDIVHNHMGWQALPPLRNFALPTVTTNHNPVKDYCAPIYLACSHLPYVSISDAYRRLNYPDRLNYVATVYNGIATEQYSKSPCVRRTHLLFIGRLCHDKGTAESIEIARRLSLPLIIAGKVDSNDRDYYEHKVRPHLDDPLIEYVGEVNDEQKADLYGRALAVVYPINFDEPFGLVMAESLASGTPVMAFDRGSVREVLSDGETAVIGKSADELVDRFSELASLSPDACRRRAQDLFSRERMAQGYEQVYERLLTSGSP